MNGTSLSMFYFKLDTQILFSLDLKNKNVQNLKHVPLAHVHGINV
jgi:hypothetical protein